MRKIVTIPALLLAALSGCFTDETHLPGPPVEPTLGLTAGDYKITVDPEKRTITLLRGETTLLELPADALQLGALPTVDDDTNYDPFPIFAPTALHPTPDELEWIAPERIQDASTGGTLTLALTYPKDRHATLTIEPRGPGSFRLALVPDAATAAHVAYMRVRPKPDAKEAFYGLGEHFDDVDQRGKIRALQIEIDGSTESGYNNVHVPVPFVIGTRGWGLFIENQRPAAFAVAAGDSDRIDAIFGTGLASKDGLVFHLFGEEKPIDITRHYYDVTGYPRLPARWALGPWVWRDECKDQAQAESDLQTMRDLDLPATGYWVDRPYASGVNTFDWYAPQFPDPQAMIDKAHDLGFGFALWHTPYLDKKAPETAALRDEAEAKGYFPKASGLPLNPWGKLIDFTNPEAYAWWQSLLSQYTSMGVEGFKLDYAEDVVPGLTAGRNVWQFADGSDERTMHAGYQLYYHRIYDEMLPSSGGFLLCRHGTYGDQRNISVIWPGDLDASFAKNSEATKDQKGEDYVAVGGLPASLIAGLTLGPSGYPFFGADTGGYVHSPPDKELFMRWFEQTALSTVMQIGNSASTVAWEPDPATGFDAEMLDWYRTYTRLHLRLFPYEWTYASAIATDGRPIARPLGLVHPELGQHPNDVYMFGDALLVAPVVERGVTSRSVPMPAGRWIDWWTGEIIDGGTTITADAPLWKLPLWLAEGSIVPMLRPTIDTMRPTTQPAIVDSYASDPGVLWARVAPGAASKFTLFDGAELTQERAEGRVKLSAKDGKEFASGVMFEVIAQGKKPAQITRNGAALVEAASLDALAQAASGWAWSSDAGGTVFVKTPAGDQSVEIAF
jgi:alpha-D-xyloside xylohydrolase